MFPVSLKRCLDYDKDVLKESFLSAFADIGFDPETFRFNRVALKPNILMPVKPEKCVITHPVFFRAAAELVKDYNGYPVLIESPNFFALETTLKKVGYQSIVDELRIEVADIYLTEVLHYEKGNVYKHIEISKAFFDVDMILNLPKLKTHAFTHMTAAVKNLFGTIPGMRKSKMHMRLPSQMEFSEFLLDLYGGLQFGFETQKPMVVLMDAVMGLEGEGPGPSGSPRHIGAVIVSEDAISADYAAALITGLDINKIFTITQGFSRDFGPNSPQDIQFLGEPAQDMMVEDFKPSKNTMYGGVFWPLTSKTLKNLFVEKPVPRKDKCVLCYQCMKTCPASAIEKAGKKGKTPVFDYNKCIRCFCCMEICPEAAIVLKKGKLQWMLKTP